MELDGRTALVTGAASGIGRATALALADAGARVGLVDLDEEGLAATAAEIVERSGEALVNVGDLTRAETSVGAVGAVMTRWGRLDCAVNAAGVEGATRDLLDEDDALYDRTMDVNVRGVWHGLRAQIPAMLTSPEGGSVVNVSSGAGLVGSRRSAIYSMSKHAVIGLTRSAALQYARQGVRVNAVCPAGVQTPMAERIISSYGGDSPFRAGSGYPLGRSSTAEEIASAILWLCSPGAASTIGATFAIDAGFTAT